MRSRPVRICFVSLAQQHCGQMQHSSMMQQYPKTDNTNNAQTAAMMTHLCQHAGEITLPSAPDTGLSVSICMTGPCGSSFYHSSALQRQSNLQGCHALALTVSDADLRKCNLPIGNVNITGSLCYTVSRTMGGISCLFVHTRRFLHEQMHTNASHSSSWLCDAPIHTVPQHSA